MHNSKQRQINKLGAEAVSYIDESKTLARYIQKKALRSQASALTYKTRLTSLGVFIHKRVGKTHTMDSFIEELKTGEVNPYDFLTDYALFLKSTGAKDEDMRQKGKIARVFLRSSGVPIDLETFKEQVPLPRKVMPEMEPAEKHQIIDLLNACKNQRLKTAILLCATVGCRIQELCAVKNNDVDLDKGTITFPGQFTKTKQTRTRPLTSEAVKQIRNWIALKYREHRTTVFGKKSMFVKPVKKDDDLLLAFWTQKAQPKPMTLADTLGNEMRELASTLKIPKKNGVYVLTFHRLRAFVFTTISELGDTEFAEWMLGHSNSTYYRSSDKKKQDAFARVQPYLTFLDMEALEATTQEMKTKVERLEKELAEKDQKMQSIAEEAALKALSEVTGMKRGHSLKGKFTAPEPEG